MAGYLATISGPKVLVGHSYGGAVIANAATAVPDVKSLVYIAGFIPARGETIGELAAQSSPALPLISTSVPAGTEVGPATRGDRTPSGFASAARSWRCSPSTLTGYSISWPLPPGVGRGCGPGPRCRA
ncbi:MAG: alpha/beta fold hydrolase [Actinoplanes sp.]